MFQTVTQKIKLKNAKVLIKKNISATKPKAEPPEKFQHFFKIYLKKNQQMKIISLRSVSMLAVVQKSVKKFEKILFKFV